MNNDDEGTDKLLEKRWDFEDISDKMLKEAFCKVLWKFNNILMDYTENILWYAPVDEDTSIQETENIISKATIFKTKIDDTFNYMLKLDAKLQRRKWWKNKHHKK